MRSEHRLSIALAALACVLFSSSRADAYCRSTTVTAPGDFIPGEGECWLQGKPIYHPSQCLPYRLTAESKVIPNAVLSDKLARAFAAWTAPNPTCTPGIIGIELAPTSSAQIVGFTTGQRNQNFVGVRADWPAGSGEMLSLATLTYNLDTGEIYDVDLEINGTASWSFDDAPSGDKADLQGALTHEVGHMLGFAHTSAPETVMFPNYTPGELGPRTLHADDQNGICTVYPNRNQRLAPAGLVPSTPCNLAPGNADGTCSDPEISHGCSMSSPGALGGTAPLGGLLLFALVLRRRRAS